MADLGGLLGLLRDGESFQCSSPYIHTPTLLTEDAEIPTWFYLFGIILQIKLIPKVGYKNYENLFG